MTDEPPYRPRGMPLAAKIAFAAALLVIASMVVGFVLWIVL